MNAPTLIDLDAWPRRQHFEHYLRSVRCSYSMTVDIDVTDFVAAVRTSGRRTYIAQVWAIGSIVNRHPEFRMTLTADGAPAVWPEAHPSFTIFHAETETFSSVSVAFDSDFGRFHDAAARVIADHAGSTELFPQGPPPPNSFDVSSLPWTDFTGFNLNVEGVGAHLAPIFTLGRYHERDDRTWLPVAVQVHHAAADGFHTARLINELRGLLSDPSWLAA
ncbi:type A chloramphenicol O-acetyltransferase [Microbacterium sp. 2P01SA-2]|uniref:type A chloramphenicol O-acetyltransferase n=1 Tax=unclassified Microbacterium TaxID=2609290 RepID=UPI00399F77F5